MVNYYFGSKSGLFVESIGLMANPGDVPAASVGLDGKLAAAELLRLILEVWEQPSAQRRVRRLLVEMESNEAVGAAFRDYLHIHVIDLIAGAVGGTKASVGANAAATLIAGLSSRDTSCASSRSRLCRSQRWFDACLLHCRRA